MRNEPGRSGFRLATLAIAGMITVSGAGAMSSLLLIDNRIGATPESPTSEPREARPRPDGMTKFVVANQVVTDAADGTGNGDEAGAGDLELAGFPDAFAAIEIVVPLLTVLAVVSAAQRFAEFGHRDGMNWLRGRQEGEREFLPRMHADSRGYSLQSTVRGESSG